MHRALPEEPYGQASSEQRHDDNEEDNCLVDVSGDGMSHALLPFRRRPLKMAVRGSCVFAR
jgi:hypothetical protein